MAAGMFQIRIHGRGGQGVVTAAELLSVAAFNEGCYAQAFPSFGSERTGAPVMAFCRIAREPIRMRDPISAPDAVIVQDATLLHQPELFAGLGRDGYVLVNSPQPVESLLPDELVRSLATDHLKSVPATEMALQRVGRPVPNTVLLGGFAALTGVVSLDSVLRAIGERFGGTMAEANRAAAADAYEYVRQHLEAYASAPAD